MSDNYAPAAYSVEDVEITVELMYCLRCGALVSMTHIHDRWHKALGQ